jgi:hypothetical protein
VQPVKMNANTGGINGIQRLPQVRKTKQQKYKIDNPITLTIAILHQDNRK